MDKSQIESAITTLNLANALGQLDTFNATLSRICGWTIADPGKDESRPDGVDWIPLKAILADERTPASAKTAILSAVVDHAVNPNIKWPPELRDDLFFRCPPSHGQQIRGRDYSGEIGFISLLEAAKLGLSDAANHDAVADNIVRGLLGLPSVLRPHQCPSYPRRSGEPNCNAYGHDYSDCTWLIFLYFNQAGSGFSLPNDTLRREVLFEILRLQSLPMRLRESAGNVLVGMTTDQLELHNFFSEHGRARFGRPKFDYTPPYKSSELWRFADLSLDDVPHDIPYFVDAAGMRIADYFIELGFGPSSNAPTPQPMPSDRTRTQPNRNPTSASAALPPTATSTAIVSCCNALAPAFPQSAPQPRVAFQPTPARASSAQAGSSCPIPRDQMEIFRQYAFAGVWGGRLMSPTDEAPACKYVPIVTQFIEGRLPFSTNANLYALLRLLDLVDYGEQRIGIADLNVTSLTKRIRILLEGDETVTTLPFIGSSVIEKLVYVLTGDFDYATLMRLSKMQNLHPDDSAFLVDAARFCVILKATLAGRATDHRQQLADLYAACIDVPGAQDFLTRHYPEFVGPGQTGTSVPSLSPEITQLLSTLGLPDSQLPQAARSAVETALLAQISSHVGQVLSLPGEPIQALVPLTDALADFSDLRAHVDAIVIAAQRSSQSQEASSALLDLDDPIVQKAVGILLTLQAMRLGVEASASGSSLAAGGSAGELSGLDQLRREFPSAVRGLASLIAKPAADLPSRSAQQGLPGCKMKLLVGNPA